MEKVRLFAILLLDILLLSCEKEDETTDGTGDSINLKRDLACHFTFDSGNANDLSGNGFNGVVSFGAKYVSDTPSGKGSSISLDGTNEQFINIPYRIIGDSVNYTLSIWLKEFGTGALITSISDNSYRAPSLYVNSDCKFVFNVSDRNYTSNSDISYLQSGAWHHVVLTATRKQKNASLYVDGQLFDTKDISYIGANDSKMVIGGNGDGHFQAWADPMLIDNFRVYRRCLSASEIQELYKQEKQ